MSRLWINGKEVAVPAGRAGQTLLTFLRGELPVELRLPARLGKQAALGLLRPASRLCVRPEVPHAARVFAPDDCGLTGTKLGCGEGCASPRPASTPSSHRRRLRSGCGACTVTVTHWDAERGAPVDRSVNACLAPLYSVLGSQVTTVEGLGNARSGLHPVQEKLACAHGSQCGFCTPGFVMSMYTLLRSRSEPPTEAQIEANLAGNLCRCTGYRPILEGFRSFSEPPPAAAEGADALTGVVEPAFPPELQVPPTALTLALPGSGTWHRPITMEALLQLKQDHPDAKIICGNTEVGIEVMIKRDLKFAHVIAATHVPELCAVEESEAGVTLGSSVTLSELEEVCKRQIAKRPPHAAQAFHAVLRQLHWFAGRQIRNVSSIGGNVVTGSPISDLNPLWLACGSVFVCQSAARGSRTIAAKDFWTGYRTNALAKDEILVSVTLPATQKYEYVHEFKQSHRRDDDIAIVTAGLRVSFAEGESGTFVVKELSAAYGGMAATTKLAEALSSTAPGLPWQNSSLQSLMAVLRDDMRLPPTVPGGMPEYRQALASSFFFKFFVSRHPLDLSRCPSR